MLSEYDLYGHHLLVQDPDGCAVAYYANTKVTDSQFLGEAPLPDAARRFRVVSNHERARDCLA